MRYLNVGSGSKGNSTIIYTAQATIIIDCGVSRKRVVDCLRSIGRSLEEVDAMLITHRHKDHTAHIESFECLKDRTYSGDAGVIDPQFQSTNVLKSFQRIEIAGLAITALPTSHDAPDSMGYLLEDLANGRRLMYMTDTGYIPFKDLNYCRDCDFYLLESNHDPETLMRSDRNNWLKMRILSDKGHLSNQQCAHYLTLLVGSRTKEVALAHLSGECNTPQLALATFNDAFIAQFGQVPTLTLKTLDQKTPIGGGDTIN